MQFAKSRTAALFRCRKSIGIRPKIATAVLAPLLLYVSAGTTLAQPHLGFTHKLVVAAVERTHHSVRYVSDYVGIHYPGGNVPPDTGVCTDEVIRVYRAVGINLQKEVHEDMRTTLVRIAQVAEEP
jgi:uncharacterized protein YijF (DUF1287 family)